MRVGQLSIRYLFAPSRHVTSVTAGTLGTTPLDEAMGLSHLVYSSREAMGVVTQPKAIIQFETTDLWLSRLRHCFRRFFHGVWVTGPMKFPSFIQEAPAASHMLSMLGLLDPASLHLATACVQVVAPADAVKAQATRTATAIGRRMGYSSESFDDRPQVATLCGRVVPARQS